MKQCVSILVLALAVVAGALLSGCGGNPRAVEMLARADSLMNGRPDSALTVLDSLLVDADHLSRRQEMRCRLLRLNAINKLDTVFTAAHSAQAQSLADYFDRHGTPNEQMLAHYILGRTFADQGETPRAVAAYNDAAERADTTATDCDYRTLCRVYSQLAEIFYQQNLLDDNLRCLDRSITYAYKANDTIAAINSYAQKLGAYDKHQMTDSIIAVSTQTYNRFSQIGYPEVGSRYLALAVNGYTQKKNLDSARHYMDIYEAKSGYFDSLGNIERGREAYYDIKGKYYLACRRLDSAEYFFRKELREGSDFNNQNKASHRLAELFQIEGKPDSVAKYALYAYSMNDSTYSQATTEAVVQMQASYDYSSHQRIAQREKDRADREKQKSEILFCIIASIILIGTIVAYRLKKRQEEERAAYTAKVNELEQVQNDVLHLRSHENELDALLREKESKLEELNDEIAKFHMPIRKIEKDSTEEKLKQTPTYQMLLAKADKGDILTNEDWHEVNRLVIAMLPKFYQLISSKNHNLSISEYRTTVLLRLHIKPKSVSCLLGCTAPYITKLSGQVQTKLFNVNGDSKKLAKIVSELS